MIQANARHGRDVAIAVEARDLNEVKRIIDRAKLTRREFSSVCDRLGFRSDEAAAGVLKSGENVASSTLPPVLPRPQTPLKMPTFFLDAEARGGTTALALATVENDAEAVRRLIQEVWSRFNSLCDALT